LKQRNKGLDLDQLNIMEKKYQEREQERLVREQLRTKQKNRLADEEDDFIEHSDDDALRESRADNYDDRYSQDADEQAAKLPSVSDPKLWRVRVKKGWERIAAMALMNK
jgi:hypothetical protein